MAQTMDGPAMEPMMRAPGMRRMIAGASIEEMLDACTKGQRSPLRRR